MAPTLFDAPGPNPPRADERWTAHTVLAVAAGVVRERVVTPVVGFRWGYELEEMRATAFAPEPANETDWTTSREVLTAAYPNWRFSVRPAPAAATSDDS